ncbi:hypothetical protein CAEBREN_17308 [Caenorhabditis brenneri]|uniref:DUF7774 domain-containing protein n=1 Tax=Caenorhabditis brenneri TaxID=135651 RepID=G0PE05_CAEBE|nr:hypothetical protein CAEBREN_17308 [Caenorhabditis brenneri]
MLGSNLGKKVTAGVVQDQYKQFLKNKPDEKKKVLTPEERKQAKRQEMRKKGIFVKADDPDETPTIMEKIEGPLQPMVYVLPEKPTVWKNAKKRTGGRKNKEKKKNEAATAKKPYEKLPKSDVSISSGPQKKKVKKEKKVPTTISSLPSTSSSGTDQSTVSKKNKSAEKSNKEPETPVKPKVSSKEPIVAEKKKDEAVVIEKKSEEKIEEKKPEEVPKEPEQVKVAEPQKVEETTQKGEGNKAILPSYEPQTTATALPSTLPSPDTTTPPTSQAPPSSQAPSTSQAPPSSKTDSSTKETENKDLPVPLTSTASNPSMVDSQKKTISAPIAENQRDAFEKLDDDEFEKMTSDADEKEILKLAPRLLKVAKKHAAIEKCLTAEENEVLAKFFSGKQKLDASVLAVLDSALDKIIDYLQKNNCAIDEETKAVMKKRDKLKAAMMKEFLVSPQYLPKTWTAKFNEWKSEAEKQKNGINWFRVLFSYPKHKSFDDGPEDTFGNFRRHNRGLLMSLLLGPGDVKSFEETKREEDCQGMFLDTKIIENATKDAKDTSSTISERHILLTAKSSKKKLN